MFNKLFDLVDKFVDKFNEINSFEDLSKIAMDVFAAIKEAFMEALSPDMDENEKIFDELMEEPGLWHKIGEKIKKAMKDKKELLKILLYLTTIMNEFQNRLRQKQKTEKKHKNFERILKKYMKYIKELLENKELDDVTRDKGIKELRKAMDRELKAVEHER